MNYHLTLGTNYLNFVIKGHNLGRKNKNIEGTKSIFLREGNAQNKYGQCKLFRNITPRHIANREGIKMLSS